MSMSIRLFAIARDIVGADSLEIELEPPVTIAAVRDAMLEKEPRLSAVLPHCLFALDEEYAHADTLVENAAIIACIPPVSGG